MSKIKYTPKELKRPDRFRGFLAESLEDLSRNFNKILAGVGVVAAGLLAAYLVSSQGDKEDLLANERFQKALESYESGEMEASVSELKALREEYPKADISTVALYQMGMISYKQEKFQEAAEHLSLFLEKSDIKDGLIRDGANLIIGLSDFKLEKWDESVKYLSKVNDSESPYYDQARRHLGIVYEKRGEKEKAERIWRDLGSE